MGKKIERLQQMIAKALEKHDADSLVVMSPENVFYTSEIFILSHRWIPQRLVLVVFHQQAPPTHIICNIQEGFVRSEEGWIKDIRVYVEFVTSPIQMLADVLKEKGLANHKVLIEKTHLNTAYYEELCRTLPNCAFEDCTPIMDRIKQQKTDEEVLLLQENARIIERALLETYQVTKPGDSERDVAATAISNLAALGYDTVDILTLCSGKTIFTNTKPGDHRLQEGDMLRIDMIGTRRGYRGDLFRQAVLGEPNPAQFNAYQRYFDALNSILEKTVVGARPCDLYETCKREFKSVQLEMDLPHIGHGIGAGLHEHPSISPLDKKPIIANMVFNIEPIGVDPMVGGFGQELTVHVTEDGPKVLSDYMDISNLYIIGS
jgi:Xaa-Pro aminopeptidase